MPIHTPQIHYNITIYKEIEPKGSNESWECANVEDYIFVLEPLQDDLDL